MDLQQNYDNRKKTFLKQKADYEAVIRDSPVSAYEPNLTKYLYARELLFIIDSLDSDAFAVVRYLLKNDIAALEDLLREQGFSGLSGEDAKALPYQ